MEYGRWYICSRYGIYIYMWYRTIIGTSRVTTYQPSILGATFFWWLNPHDTESTTEIFWNELWSCNVATKHLLAHPSCLGNVIYIYIIIMYIYILYSLYLHKFHGGVLDHIPSISPGLPLASFYPSWKPVVAGAWANKIPIKSLFHNQSSTGLNIELVIQFHYTPYYG